MSLGHGIAKAAGRALSSVHAGADKLAAASLVNEATPRLTVTSPSFQDQAPLPQRFTTDGAGEAPELRWTAPPTPASAFVLLCEDPDAPKTEPFVHWLVYDIAGDARRLDARTAEQARQGKNSTMSVGFTPAAPPPGHGLHHYHFQLFALDAPLGLDDRAGRGAVLDAMKDHVVAFGELVGTYERQ